MRSFSTCEICGAPGHGARHCPLGELEKRRDPFGEALRIQRAREQLRRPRALVMSGAPDAAIGPLISSTRRV
jgi:hypothetical protein